MTSLRYSELDLPLQQAERGVSAISLASRNRIGGRELIVETAQRIEGSVTKPGVAPDFAQRFGVFSEILVADSAPRAQQTPTPAAIVALESAPRPGGKRRAPFNPQLTPGGGSPA